MPNDAWEGNFHTWLGMASAGSRRAATWQKVEKCRRRGVLGSTSQPRPRMTSRAALGPDRLAGTGTVAYAPVGGERVDEDQAATAVLVRGGSLARRLGGVGVGDLDPDCAPGGVVGQRQGEVPPRDPAVEDRVRGEFGDDEDDGVVRLGAVRVAPLGQLVGGEQSGEARTAAGGGETLRERRGRGGALRTWS